MKDDSFAIQISHVDKVYKLFSRRRDRLIDAFSLIAERYPGWHVDIFGEGNERQKILDQSFLFFKIASAQTKGSAQKSDDELRLFSNFFTDGILSRLDFYIAQKKETIRRNPECDAGSLFALPSDEKQIGVITAFAVDVLKNVI